MRFFSIAIFALFLSSCGSTPAPDFASMSSEEIMIWQAQEAKRQEEVRRLQNSINQLGQSAQSWGQQFQTQSQQYNPPQIQTVEPNSGWQIVTYSQQGEMLIGSNGVTYQKVGNSIVSSDGTVCQIVGSTLICR